MRRICAEYAPHVRRMCAELPYHSISLHFISFHFIPFHSISLQKTTLSIKKNSVYKTLCTLFSLVLSFCFGKKSRVEGCIKEQFVRPYEKWLRMTGIMSDGGIDEQALCSALEAAFSEMKSVSFMGFTFSMQDAERLLQRMVE